jgi:endonuclease/exonuclease/phosphatase family metal-dependent hydrolase
MGVDQIDTDGVITSPPDRSSSHGSESWIAIRTIEQRAAWVTPPFERLAAATIATVNGREIVVYGSVLPWHSAPRQIPELALRDESFAAMFERYLNAQVADLEDLRSHHPRAVLIWAGDFNQSLDGPNLVGSRSGRLLLRSALDHLGFTAWNQNEHHANAELVAIDLICGPRDLCIIRVDRIDPFQNGRQLSDHAGYVVDIK